MIGDGARNAAGLPKLLSYGGLVRLRLTSSIGAYFILAVCTNFTHFLIFIHPFSL